MAVEYDRPVGPWLAVIGTYAMVAGLVALLGYTAKRAIDSRGSVPRAEYPRLARDLRDEKERNLPRSVGGGIPEGFLRDYIKDPRILVCANIERRTRETWWPERASPAEDASYCYVSGLTLRDPPSWPVVFDEEWNHGGHGVVVGYTGGHVRWVRDRSLPAREFADAARARGGRNGGLRLLRPWWSRSPQPPAFIPPPEEKTAPPISKAYVVIAAIAFALGAFVLGRYARRSG